MGLQCRHCTIQYTKNAYDNQQIDPLYDGLCSKCCALYYKEYHRFQKNRSRLSGTGIAKNLTFAQWISTLNHFGWKCAYCQSQPHAVLEHYIPVVLGGGTICSNCVPACKSCNKAKHIRHPDQVTTISRRDLDRVCAYLAGVK